MEKIFDIAKDSEQSWGTLATAIDRNFDEASTGIQTAAQKDELAQVRSDLSETITALEQEQKNTKNLGHTVSYVLDSTEGFYRKDGTTVDTKGFKRGTATVSANKLIRIVTNLYFPNASLVIKDGNNNIIKYFEGENIIQYKEYSFISPNNGATVLFSCYNYDEDIFTLFEYDIVNYVAALNDIASLQNNDNAAEEYVKPIVIDWVSGKYFNNRLQLLTFDNVSYFEYSNTKVGEKYLIYVSDGYGAFTQGIRNTDNTVYKSWSGEKIDWELIEITEDGQTICLSYYDNAIYGRWSYNLIRLGYTKNEDNIKTIQEQIVEINKSLIQKSIPIIFTNDGFFNTNLNIITWGSGGAGHFEYSNTHVGEKYYIYVSGGTGSFCQGIRNPDNTVYKLWNKVGVDEIVEITQDGQAICLSQFYSENWEFKLTKLLYTKNEDAIEDINKRIAALSSFTSSVASMGVPAVALPNYDYNHIIVYGQSFAVGNGPQGKNTVIDGNYMLGSTNSATANKDRTVLNGLTSTNGGGIVAQCTNAFSKMWNRSHNSKFIATSGGYGGTTIEELSKGTQYYSDLLTELTSIKAIADNENKSVGCIAVVFVQGESNYTNTEGHAQDKSTYKYLVNKFIDDVQSDIQSIYGQNEKPIILMYQTGYGYWLPNSKEMAITMAQIELAKDREDVLLGCPTYNVAFNNTNHPSGSGYAMIGETMAKHLYNLMEKNLRSEGTHPIVVSKSGNAVNIGCYALVQPLVVDTHTSPKAANNGFKLYVDGVDSTISSVTVNGSSIVITTPNSLDGHIVEVAYASKGTDGKGNICDSDSDYMSWQTYINEQNMLQQPYDNDGRSIVGKRLPLQNYLSNFYMNVDFYFYKHLYRLSTSDTQFTPKLYNNTALSVTFTTSDSSIVTVTNDGSITPVSAGYAIIKASVTKDYKTWTDEILVIVE